MTEVWADDGVHKLLETLNQRQQAFLSLGTGSGKELLASKRIHEAAGDTLYWGDATSNHGWYLASLAFQHRLCKTLECKTEIKKRLADGLQTINRLDETIDAKLDGFFARDDISEDLIPSFPGVIRIDSDFMASRTNPQMYEMSQDQAIHLIFGLTTVLKLIKEEPEIMTEARSILKRIASYISKDGWRIRNSITGMEVGRGADARIMSYGLSRAVSEVCSDCDIAKPKRGSIIFWKTIAPTTLIPKYFNRSMIGALGVAGNVWGRNNLKVMTRLERFWGNPIFKIMEKYFNGQKLPKNELQKISSLLQDDSQWNCTNRFMDKPQDCEKPTPGISYPGHDRILLAALYLLNDL